MYTIAICWHKIEEQRYKSECHAQKIKYPGPLKVDVKSHIANGIVQSCIVTVCVLLVMSPASHQIVKVGSNTPAPALDFDMPLGARANIQPAIKTTDTSSSGNSHIHTDNGNSGQIKIKLDAKQQMSGSNIKLDEINN